MVARVLWVVTTGFIKMEAKRRRKSVNRKCAVNIFCQNEGALIFVFKYKSTPSSLTAVLCKISYINMYTNHLFTSRELLFFYNFFELSWQLDMFLDCIFTFLFFLLSDSLL